MFEVVEDSKVPEGRVTESNGVEWQVIVYQHKDNEA